MKFYLLRKWQKLLFILPFFISICSPLRAENVIISESVQATATERNNARLIVEDLAGNLHVVYYDNGIYYSFSDDNGENWLSPSILITDLGRNPSIALDSNNLLHLVYKKGGTVAYDIVHRTYNGSWSEEELVQNDLTSPVSRPVIAIDNENNLHCIWQRAGFSSTPNSEIWYNKYTVSTGWSETSVNISNSFGASEYPTITIDNDNNLYAFWKDSGENIDNDKMVLSRKYTAGIGWDENYLNVSNTSGNGSYATMDPCAIADSENNIHLVWKDSESGTREIYYKKLTNGIWDEFPLNISNLANASGRPSICVDNSDNLFVAWENKVDGIYYDIVCKKFDKINGIWEEIQNLSNTPESDSRHPASPILKKSNDFYVLWTEGENSPFSIMINSYYCAQINPPQNLNITELGYATYEVFPNDNLIGFNIYLGNELMDFTTDQFYQFTELINGQSYTGKVSAIYDEDEESELIEFDFIYYGTNNDEEMIFVTKLIGNYPNPFNPSAAGRCPTTTIAFSVANGSDNTEISIYNIKGQKVRSLVNEKLEAGEHKINWNGKNDQDKKISSGIYFYKLHCGNYSRTRKMIMLK